MALSRNLLILPPHRLDAFTATGVLAELLAFEPSRAVDIIAHESQVPFFLDAPAGLNFTTHDRTSGVMPRLQLMGAVMGRNWHRIISLAPTRLPFLLWAKHRHIYKFEAGSYALPALFADSKLRPPHIFMPDKQHLALPETLAPTAPIIVFAMGESGRAQWDWRHYAELAWRLAEGVPHLKTAHIVVLSRPGCPIAGPLVDNIPAGQISRFDDLPFGKAAALFRRASLWVGTDRLMARMASAMQTDVVLRLDGENNQMRGRPYGLYVGQDASQVANYIATKNLPKNETGMQASAMTKSVE